MRQQFWEDVWNNAQGLPANLPRVTHSTNRRDFRQPSTRMAEAIGSTTNARNFVLLQNSVNVMKGLIEIFKDPIGADRFDDFMNDVGNGDQAAIEQVLAIMRDVSTQSSSWKLALSITFGQLVGVFQYVNDEDIMTRFDTVATSIYDELRIIEVNTFASAGLSAHWNNFYPFYYAQVSERARTWLSDAIRRTREALQQTTTSNNPTLESTLKALNELEDQVETMMYPFE